jgi:hypothetical protein
MHLPGLQQAFPMAGNGTIFDFCTSFTDGNGIDNPALGVPVNAGVPRATDPPLRSQMPNQHPVGGSNAETGTFHDNFEWRDPLPELGDWIQSAGQVWDRASG